MRALFVYSNKYDRCNNGYYSITQTAEVWEKRYLNIFDELWVVGRVIDVENVSGKKISNTDGVCFKCTKMGINSIDYFLKYNKIKEYLNELVKQVDFVIARQSFFGAIAAECARKNGKKYIVEVVGSSWDSNWNYSLKGKLVAPFFELQAKSMVKNAKNVIYVTQQYLQKEYPTKGKTIGISNVEINTTAVSVLNKRISKIHNTDLKKISVCTVAAVDVKYKGQEYVIQAISRLRRIGINVQYFIVGGGSQDRLRRIAEIYNVTNNVCFTGVLVKNEVFEILDKCDIYIQPSLQEGLPRALIEAMSRGLPAIGYKTAGIPELIDNEYVCRRKSVNQICSIISGLNIKKMEETAIRNYNVSKKYTFDILNKNRAQFINNAICEEKK